MGRGRKKVRKPQPANDEAAVNEFASRHGEYRDATVVDLSGELGGGRQRMTKVLRNIYPSVVDRWLAEGGAGFEEPQRQAIEHCRALWGRVGSARLVANYERRVGGGDMSEGAASALAQLAEYQSDIPVAYWRAFENVVRFDMPAGRAGSHLATTTSQQQAHAKAATGFVASLIAMWRRY